MCDDLDAGPLWDSLIWFQFMEDVGLDGEVEPKEIKVFKIYHLRILYHTAQLSLLNWAVLTIDWLYIKVGFHFGFLKPTLLGS